MTTDDLVDLASISRAVRSIDENVRRIDAKLARQDERVDKLERVSDQALAVLTFMKWALGFVGFGGVSLIVWAISQR